MAKRPKSSIPAFKRKRKGRGFFGWLLRIVLGLILFSIALVLAYRFVPPPITATMVGDLFAGRGVSKDWMSLDEMDRDMVRAAIAAEDGKFCQHNGFDFEAIEDAMKRNASGGRIRGGSTISQQTAKNVFLWQGGGYARKGGRSLFHLPDRESVGQAPDHGGLSQRRRDGDRHLWRQCRLDALFRP